MWSSIFLWRPKHHESGNIYRAIRGRENIKLMTETKNIKIGIIGLGPVGMILASKFQEAGCEVALCVRNEVKFKKIQNEGIVLENVIQSTS